MALDLGFQDYINAGLYASQKIKLHRYTTQRNETRWNLPPYEIFEKPFNDEFYIPDKLKKTFKLYYFKFPERSCGKMACFFNLRHDTMCPRNISDRKYKKLQIGPDIYNICQDACYNMAPSMKVPFTCETYFENGTCYMRNTNFKKYCIFPESRNQDLHYHVPPFFYNENTGECFITKEYCKRYGEEFDTEKKDCYITDDQRYVEQFLTGSTLFRAFKIEFGRLEQSGFDENVLSDALLSVLHDASIDVTMYGIKHLSLKTVPLLNKAALEVLMAQFQRKFGLSIARASVIALVLENCKFVMAAKVALQIASAIGSASTIVGFVLLALSVTGLILDIVDPLELNGQISKKQLDKTKRGFEYIFEKDLKQNTVCAPEFFINLYSEGRIDEIERSIYMEELGTYFSNLEYNSEGRSVVSPLVIRDTAVEDVITKILDKSSRVDDSTSKIKSIMDRLFSKSLIFFCVLIPIFLAITI